MAHYWQREVSERKENIAGDKLSFVFHWSKQRCRWIVHRRPSGKWTYTNLKEGIGSNGNGCWSLGFSHCQTPVSCALSMYKISVENLTGSRSVSKYWEPVGRHRAKQETRRPQRPRRPCLANHSINLYLFAQDILYHHSSKTGAVISPKIFDFSHEYNEVSNRNDETKSKLPRFRVVVCIISCLMYAKELHRVCRVYWFRKYTVNLNGWTLAITLVVNTYNNSLKFIYKNVDSFTSRSAVDMNDV